MGTIEKQAELTAGPVVNKLGEVQDTIKKSNEKTSKDITTTTIATSNDISTSISDSSAVTTGGGGGGRDRGTDPWYNQAVLGGMY